MSRLSSLSLSRLPSTLPSSSPSPSTTHLSSRTTRSLALAAESNLPSSSSSSSSASPLSVSFTLERRGGRFEERERKIFGRGNRKISPPPPPPSSLPPLYPSSLQPLPARPSRPPPSRPSFHAAAIPSLPRDLEPIFETSQVEVAAHIQTSMLVGGGGGGGREEAVERRRPVDEGEGMSEDSGRSWLGGERKEESTLVETEGKAKPWTSPPPAPRTPSPFLVKLSPKPIRKAVSLEGDEKLVVGEKKKEWKLGKAMELSARPKTPPSFLVGKSTSAVGRVSSASVALLETKPVSSSTPSPHLLADSPPSVLASQPEPTSRTDSNPTTTTAPSDKLHSISNSNPSDQPQQQSQVASPPPLVGSPPSPPPPRLPFFNTSTARTAPTPPSSKYRSLPRPLRLPSAIFASPPPPAFLLLRRPAGSTTPRTTNSASVFPTWKATSTTKKASQVQIPTFLLRPSITELWDRSGKKHWKNNTGFDQRTNATATIKTKTQKKKAISIFTHLRRPPLPPLSPARSHLAPTPLFLAPSLDSSPPKRIRRVQVMDGRLRETERLRRLSSWPEERWAEKFQKVEVERVLLGGSSGLDGKREIKSLSQEGNGLDFDLVGSEGATKATTRRPPPPSFVFPPRSPKSTPTRAQLEMEWSKAPTSLPLPQLRPKSSFLSSKTFSFSQTNERRRPQPSLSSSSSNLLKTLPTALRPLPSFLTSSSTNGSILLKARDLATQSKRRQFGKPLPPIWMSVSAATNPRKRKSLRTSLPPPLALLPPAPPTFTLRPSSSSSSPFSQAPLPTFLDRDPAVSGRLRRSTTTSSQFYGLEKKKKKDQRFKSLSSSKRIGTATSITNANANVNASSLSSSSSILPAARPLFLRQPHQPKINPKPNLKTKYKLPPRPQFLFNRPSKASLKSIERMLVGELPSSETRSSRIRGLGGTPVPGARDVGPKERFGPSSVLGKSTALSWLTTTKGLGEGGKTRLMGLEEWKERWGRGEIVLREVAVECDVGMVEEVGGMRKLRQRPPPLVPLLRRRPNLNHNLLSPSSSSASRRAPPSFLTLSSSRTTTKTRGGTKEKKLVDVAVAKLKVERAAPAFLLAPKKKMEIETEEVGESGVGWAEEVVVVAPVKKEKKVVAEKKTRIEPSPPSFLMMPETETRSKAVVDALARQALITSQETAFSRSSALAQVRQGGARPVSSFSLSKVSFARPTLLPRIGASKVVETLKTTAGEAVESGVLQLKQAELKTTSPSLRPLPPPPLAPPTLFKTIKVEAQAQESAPKLQPPPHLISKIVASATLSTTSTLLDSTVKTKPKVKGRLPFKRPVPVVPSVVAFGLKAQTPAAPSTGPKRTELYASRNYIPPTPPVPPRLASEPYVPRPRKTSFSPLLRPPIQFDSTYSHSPSSPPRQHIATVGSSSALFDAVRRVDMLRRPLAAGRIGTGAGISLGGGGEWARRRSAGAGGTATAEEMGMGGF